MTNDFSPSELWRFFPFGYLVTILIETPILCFGLSKLHPLSRRLFAGVWLTACTYPIVTLVLPLLLGNHSRTVFLIVAETFAPVVECILFWLAFGSRKAWDDRSVWRDFATIVAANLASFAVGELLNLWEWFGFV
jgi:predicted Na+-dependent transporter